MSFIHGLHLNLDTYLIAVCLGGAALALWTDHRFPGLRPGLSWLLGALVLSTFVVVGVSPPVITHSYKWAEDLRHGAGFSSVAVSATLLIAYCFLVALWAFHAAIDQTGSRGGGLRSKA